MKRTISFIISALLSFSVLSGCGNTAMEAEQTTVASIAETEAGQTPVVSVTETEAEGELSMVMTIGDTRVDVIWENNASVDELKELASERLTISMSMYGGFEQVGSIGESITHNDEQTTTSAGDIVLYSGDQLVVFYGSNSWSYTRLGKIDMSVEELTELLSNGDVNITLAME